MKCKSSTLITFNDKVLANRCLGNEFSIYDRSHIINYLNSWRSMFKDYLVFNSLGTRRRIICWEWYWGVNNRIIYNFSHVKVGRSNPCLLVVLRNSTLASSVQISHPFSWLCLVVTTHKQRGKLLITDDNNKLPTLGISCRLTFHAR